jgi:hypothetical protein
MCRISAVGCLDVYADIFDDDLGAIAERLDVLAQATAQSRAGVGRMWAQSGIAVLDEQRADA